MQPPYLNIGLTNAQPVALPFGVLLCLYLHRHPMRGDTWLLLEIILASLLFVLDIFASGDTSGAIYYSLSFVVYHLTILVLSTVAYRLSPFHPLYSFPGPILCKITSLRLLHIVSTGKRYETLHRLHQKYGVVIRTGPNTLSINSHCAVAPIYASASAWNKSSSYALGLFQGAGLFFIQNKEEHNARKRDYWTPAFSSLSAYTPILYKRNKQLLGVIKRDQVATGLVNFTDILQRWSHDVTGDITFGDANCFNLLMDGDPRGIVESTLVGAITWEILVEAPSLFHILWYLPVSKTVKTLGTVAEEEIAARKRNRSQQRDIMSYLLDEAGDGANQLPQNDLRQEAVLAVQAGTNGVSAALTFAFYYILCNPQVYESLYHELRKAFVDYDDDTNLDLRVLAELPYLNAVVSESLRLGAPLGSFYRISPTGGAVIAGQLIPEGTVVSIPAWAQMISEENFYPAPTEFIPERWLPGGLGPGSRADKSAIMTFSWGPYGCMGKSLAIQEMRIVLAEVFLCYRLKLPKEFNRTAFMEGVRNMRVTSFAQPLKLHVERRM